MSDASPEKLELMDFFEREAILTFRDLGVQNPRVYVYGHGLPGVMSVLSSANGGGPSVHVKRVAQMLADLQLPSGSDVRVVTCFGGAGKAYPGDSSDWWERFHSGTLGEVSDIENSFAAALHNELKVPLHFHGTTSGYLTGTAQTSDEDTIERGSEKPAGRHMVGLVTFRDPKGGWREVPGAKFPRRRDLRVQFPQALTM
jgi:hypothetical protein